MTEIILKLMLLAPLGAFMNWFVRGGGWKSALYNNAPPFDIPGKFINAFVYGVAVWCLCGSAVFAVIASVAMYAGSVSRLGIYVSAMKGEQAGYDVNDGIDGLTMRGAIWGLALAMQWLFTGNDGHILAATLFVIAGAAQGMIYYEWIEYFKTRKNNNVLNHWTVSEMVHGALLWLPLALV